MIVLLGDNMHVHRTNKETRAILNERSHLLKDLRARLVEDIKVGSFGR